ncbi:MAG: hypothetical protein NTW94_01050 [Legionellales bacterium]|nr:hypothetical protein [Legionellales bacterium]
MCFMKRFKINRLTKKLTSLQQSRVHNPANEEQLKKEINTYRKLALIYNALMTKKKYPFARLMVLECYRSASAIEDSDSQFQLGKHLLDEAIFRDQLQQRGLFASPSNARQATQLYEEAHAYLSAAVTLHNIKAKRLHGLCYINGWGVLSDKKRGFEMIVESIDDEQSWDKVPQIFAELHLNKPEFYSALTEHRKNSVH